MDVTARLRAPCEPVVLFAWVDDLDRYPAWLDLVPRVAPAPLADGDAGPGWWVDLRGRVGPLARTKRLRMVRTVHDPPATAVFERREQDRRDHSPWVLRAEVARAHDDTGHGAGSQLTVYLHYGGGVWGPLLERPLRDAIERSGPRLLACVAVEGAG